MEYIRQIYTCCIDICENIVSFCDKYSNVATVIGLIITVIGLLGIQNLVRKRRETNEFRDKWPVCGKTLIERLKVYANASDNGVSQIRVKEND